jgi:hypothetical protein
LLEGEVPVLVALVPPEILQAAPELVRLLDAADFLAARESRLGGKLEDELAQGFLEAVGEVLVVKAVGDDPTRIVIPSDQRERGISPRVRGILALRLGRMVGITPSIVAGHSMLCPYGRGGGAFDGDDGGIRLLIFCLCGHSWLAYFVYGGMEAMGVAQSSGG